MLRVVLYKVCSHHQLHHVHDKYYDEERVRVADQGKRFDEELDHQRRV